jgi:ACS family hexuronate transporter-like MFS transporter
MRGLTSRTWVTGSRMAVRSRGTGEPGSAAKPRATSAEGGTRHISKTADETLEEKEPANKTSISARTWGICFLLFVATSIVYLDRQVLALTASKIISEFGLTNEQFGQIVGAFRYSYGLVQIFGGFLVDGYGPRIVFPVAGGAWSLVGLLTGFATTVGMLTGLRFLLGASEAFNWPCSLKATNSLLSPKDRPLANGIFNSGGAMGALVAPLIVTWITLRWSWRAAFVITGAVGGLWVFAWLWMTQKTGDSLKGKTAKLSEIIRVVGRLMAMREFWILAVSALVVNGVNYYLSDWIPLYLETTRGFSFARGNFLSIVIYGGTFSGNLLVGLFVRLLIARGCSTMAAKRWALFAACLLMVAAIPAGLTVYRYAAVIFLALTGIGVGAFLVIYLTLVQDLDPAYVGVSSGLLGGLSNIAYGAVSRYIGLLADHHDTTLILLLIGILPWFAFGAIFLGPRFQRQ